MEQKVYECINNGRPVALFLTESPENKVIDNLLKTDKLRDEINYFYFPRFLGYLTHKYKKMIVRENITIAFSDKEERDKDFINACEFLGIEYGYKAILLIYEDEIKIQIVDKNGYDDISFRNIKSLGRYSPRKIRTFFRFMGYEDFSYEITNYVPQSYGGFGRYGYVKYFVIPTLKEVTERGENFYDFFFEATRK